MEVYYECRECGCEVKEAEQLLFVQEHSVGDEIGACPACGVVGRLKIVKE